ncbi:DUF4440 domain-containing protein [Streptomyces sp. NPDC088146]|uniref:DUF4440 domain-containing protein n=1 Tax=Streptomyces sp. NPDC088146 TaxID=3365829 RepID=UPI00382E6886
MSDVKAELDQLMHSSLGAFTNTGGSRPNVDAVREVFIPQGVVIRTVGGEPVIYNLDACVEPREKVLADGTLTDFSEWEVAERTEIFGSIVHRFSDYRKSGFLDGEWFEGSGRKTTQWLQYTLVMRRGAAGGWPGRPPVAGDCPAALCNYRTS